MSNAREEARRNATVLTRIWWLVKGAYWRVKILVCPACERRLAERLTAKAAEHALRASLTQMVEALQQEENKNELR